MIALAAVLVLIAAACGGDEGGDTTTTAPTPGPSDTTTTTTPAGDGDGDGDGNGDGDGDGNGDGDADGLTISIEGFAYSPASPTVSVGTTVVWINLDAVDHTASADGGAFNGSMAGGGQFEWVADTPGTYDYVCQIHLGMAGTITVEG